jgi:metal-sulfur cluster biosynthetic enzyme
MEIADKTALETKVIEVLTTCFDPEIPTNIYDLGLIYDIDIDDQANVSRSGNTASRSGRKD